MVPRKQRSNKPTGFTLVEVMVVVVVISVLITMSIPRFQRTIEQSRVEIAAANLRAIWTAQRLYWLEYRTYATDLNELVTADMLDSLLVSGTRYYVCAIDNADNQTFAASATRTGSNKWTGALTIDEAGDLSGSIQALGETPISPSL